MNSKTVKTFLALCCLFTFAIGTITGCGGGGGGGSSTGITAPQITSSPNSLATPAGTSATFTVVATGSGLTYQWYKVNTSNQGVAISGATSASYTISSVSATDGGSYYAVVTN